MIIFFLLNKSKDIYHKCSKENSSQPHAQAITTPAGPGMQCQLGFCCNELAGVTLPFPIITCYAVHQMEGKVRNIWDWVVYSQDLSAVVYSHRNGVVL